MGDHRNYLWMLVLIFLKYFLYDWQLINDFPKLEVVDDRVKYCWSGGLKTI